MGGYGDSLLYSLIMDVVVGVVVGGIVRIVVFFLDVIKIWF